MQKPKVPDQVVQLDIINFALEDLDHQAVDQYIENDNEDPKAIAIMNLRQTLDEQLLALYRTVTAYYELTSQLVLDYEAASMPDQLPPRSQENNHHANTSTNNPTTMPKR